MTFSSFFSSLWTRVDVCDEYVMIDGVVRLYGVIVIGDSYGDSEGVRVDDEVICVFRECF